MRRLLICGFAALATAGLVSQSYAQTRFAVVLNEQNNLANGDSQRSVSFFDADDMTLGPLFSVFVGYEALNNFDDPQAIDVDPETGDVYLLAFDSGTTPGVADGGSDGLDTTSDFDIYKINFATVFDYWKTNHQGRNVRAENLVDAFSPTPTAGFVSRPDYVTYGAPQPAYAGGFDFATSHSNTKTLAGSVEKIGEVKRNNSTNPSPFFPNILEFVDENTLLLIDDSVGPDTAESAATDHQYRVFERVSTSPGAANDAVGDFLDGGFNRGNTESWNSRRIGSVHLDTVAGVPTGHSEPIAGAYYQDPVSGVRGMWVIEDDGQGDDIAFMEIDNSNNFVGYRPHAVGTGPTYPTSFALDNDPFVNATLNDGKGDNIFVDADSGDIIIVESGLGDLAAGIGPEHEPAIIRREVISYDDGTGKIDFGAWSEKKILNPTKTPGESTSFLERGQWSAWDSITDQLFIFAPGNGAPETPQFGYDMWVLDFATGVTTSFLDIDASVSLFQSIGFGDKADFFTLPGEGVDGDFDGDGDVDGRDFLAWQRGLSPTPFSGADLLEWQTSYNGGALSGLNAVPEPSSLLILALAVAPLACGRKR